MRSDRHAVDLSDAVILVVDDVAANRQVLSAILRKAGYQVLSAGNAAQALQRVEVQVPDLILLDIMMPGDDGYSLCAKLQEHPRTQDVPIIFLSALRDIGDKLKAFELGGADYVTKPVHGAEVLARVTHQLKIARLHKALEQEKAELVRLNQELRTSKLQTANVFSALSEHLPGSILDGKYRIDQQIGVGGYGVVFRALQVALERPVAVKIFRPIFGLNSTEAVSRFRNEGISACRVNHPSAVMVLDSGVSSEGIVYLVMELLSGPTLHEYMLQQPQLSLSRCFQLMLPLCEVLVAAHAAGIVHRDIKPENILLHQSVQGEVVKVLDFGIAKLLERDSRDRTTMAENDRLPGTPEYMAPERCTGLEHDGRSDVYSAAMILYELLCGQGPFGRDLQNVHRVLLNHIAAEPTSPRLHRPNIPPALEALILRALKKEPAQRPTAQEFRDELCAVMSVAPAG